MTTILACPRRFDPCATRIAPTSIVLVAALLSGCGATLPSAGGNPLSTGSIEARKAAPEPVVRDCNIDLHNGRRTTVQSLLDSARATDSDNSRTGNASQSALSPDCAAARTRAQAAAISRGPLEELNASESNAAMTIEFIGDDERLASKDKAALSSFVASNRSAGRRTVRIFAGRGGGGNVFEQVVLAQKRARTVQAMLPSNIHVFIEFDPALADDTVRLEFATS